MKDYGYSYEMYSGTQSYANSFLRDIVLDTFDNVSRDEDNILDQINIKQICPDLYYDQIKSNSFICFKYIWSKFLSSSLDELFKLSKTTSLQKLFAYDCVTLYLIPYTTAIPMFSIARNRFL